MTELAGGYAIDNKPQHGGGETNSKPQRMKRAPFVLVALIYH